jgi:Flp pilus assembly CpaF family ATPase
MKFGHKILLASTLLLISLFWFVYGIWAISVNGGLFHTNIYQYKYSSPKPVTSAQVQSLTSEISVSPYLIQLPTYTMNKDGLWVMDNEPVLSQPLANYSDYGLVLDAKSPSADSNQADAGCITVTLAFALGLGSVLAIRTMFNDKRKLDHTLPDKE